MSSSPPPQQPPPNSYIAYVRGESNPEQREAIHRWAVATNNTIVTTRDDDTWDPKMPLEERPGWRDVLADLEVGLARNVVVAEFQYLSRRMGGTFDMMRLFV